MDNLPPLREVIKQFDLQAKKNLGQNFLCDLNLTAKIARQAGELAKAIVLEIGPGPGGLTRALLAQGAHVIAVEKDERCLPALQLLQDYYQGQLEIIVGDALQYSVPQLLAKRTERIKIVANLPYNIGTNLLVSWLLNDEWPPFYQSLTLLFQKEVAQRIVAKPDSAHYGRLAVLAGWRTEAHIAFDIPAQAFTPPPKVTSTLVHLVPRQMPYPCEKNKLEKVTGAAFGQRRKMLRQSLKGLGGNDLLERCAIDGTRRAETLSIEEFIRLANAI